MKKLIAAIAIILMFSSNVSAQGLPVDQYYCEKFGSQYSKPRSTVASEFLSGKLGVSSLSIHILSARWSDGLLKGCNLTIDTPYGTKSCQLNPTNGSYMPMFLREPDGNLYVHFNYCF